MLTKYNIKMEFNINNNQKNNQITGVTGIKYVNIVICDMSILCVAYYNTYIE